MASEPAISVFVRVRPLTPAEHEQGSAELEGLALTGCGAEGEVLPGIGGFSGVLGQGASNADVFERCFAGRIGTVLMGGTASLFCYGYTGGGKTHTVLGYPPERGLFFLAAERLLAQLAAQPQGAEALFLQATAFEVCNDAVYDLLGAEKLECTLRTNTSGGLHVAGRSVTEQLDGVAPGEKGEHATLLTVDAGLRSATVREPEHLQEISRSCVAQRASGHSTTHHQSSRSHAILRLEVVNAAVQAAQARLARAESVLPALQNAADNVGTTRMHRELFAESGNALRRACEPREKANHYQFLARQDDLWISRTVAADGSAVTVYSDGGHLRHSLREQDAGETRCTDEWAEHLGSGPLVFLPVVARRQFPGGDDEWEATKLALERERDALKRRVVAAQEEVEEAGAALAALQGDAPPALGGSMVLVDLAGADYDHRAGAAQKESAAINKSLLALKECFRSLAKVSQTKPKFRDSKLTRILEDSLAPAASSARRNAESVSVM